MSVWSVFAGFAFAAWGAALGALVLFVFNQNDIVRFGAAWGGALCTAVALGATVGAYIARLETELDV